MGTKPKGKPLSSSMPWPRTESYAIMPYVFNLYSMSWKMSEWKTLIWVLPSCLHWCARAKFLSKFVHFLPNSLSTCFVPNLFPCSFDFLRTKWNAFWWQITPRLLVCHQNPDSGVLNRVTTFCINFCSSSALIGAIQLCCVTAHCAVHNAYFV